MINTQPIEKREPSYEGTLQVHSIFKTIQGEGPFCGTPCVFIRLAGCNLQCPMCDTDYTSKRYILEPRAIVLAVRDEWLSGPATGTIPEGVTETIPSLKLVVITGGEPFRQHIGELIDMLIHNGFYVQVESNGTMNPPVAPWNKNTFARKGAYLVVSPKTGKLNPLAEGAACAFKYVVRYGDADSDGLPKHALDMPNRPARPTPGLFEGSIYIQPLDSKNEEENRYHMEQAVRSSLAHGYILQLQIHKLIGVE